MSASREQIIYSIGFHPIRPKGRYQYYQFLSRKKAYSFYESIRYHPGVHDGYLAIDYLSNLSKYNGIPRERRDRILRSFDYADKPKKIFLFERGQKHEDTI